MTRSNASPILLTVLLLNAGCASIVSKSQWPVAINSNPSGATVTIKNKHGMDLQKGTTPMTITLKGDDGFFTPAGYQFQFEKDGYFPSTVSSKADMNAWYFGNILFGGLIGMVIVDPATGAMWKMDDSVIGNLSADPNAPANKTGKLDPAAQPTQAVPTPATQTNQVAPAAPNEDTATKLKKLKDLKDNGVLNDEEYESRRKALVEKL